MTAPAARVPARRTTALAPAKVNLHLEVLRARRDGYHDLETIFQAVALFDRLTVTLSAPALAAAADIQLRVTPREAAPAGPDNLCWAAAEHFCAATGWGGRLRIDLHKEIPTAAGLGGGSSDAAAVLVACNRLFGVGLDVPALEQLGCALGADVPFFVRGGTALGRGRGDQLTPLPAIRAGRFLIVRPDLPLSTAAVYARLKMGLTLRSPKCSIRPIKALIARFPTSSWFGFNRLEEVVLPEHPVLQRLVLRLREIAPVAMLSGSGAAVVAVFDEEAWRPGILEEFDHPGWFVRVVSAHPAGVVFKDE